MDALIQLLESLVNVFWSLLDVVTALVLLIVPWLPVIAWVGFWMFAVNWARVFPVLWRGGFVGVLLLMFAAVLVWAAVAPPPDGHHLLFGLTVGNYAGKFIYVTLLTCIALLCGSAQMSGTFGRFGQFPEAPADHNLTVHAVDHHGHHSAGHHSAGHHSAGHQATGHSAAH